MTKIKASNLKEGDQIVLGQQGGTFVVGIHKPNTGEGVVEINGTLRDIGGGETDAVMVWEEDVELEARRDGRPDSVADQHLDYLDELRESGATNMFGAGEYLMDEFDMDRTTARTILKYWMETYGERHPGS